MNKQRSIRVLHIINGEFYSGAERVQDLLAQRLPDFDVEVGFVCIKEGIFPEKCQAHDIPMHVYPMRKKWDFRLLTRIKKLIKDEQYGLIHTHTARTALVGSAVSVLAGVPMVHHVHSPTARDTEDGLRNKLNTIVEKVSLFKSSHLITVSQSLSNYCADLGYSKDKVSVVRNGVSIQDLVSRSDKPNTPYVIGVVALFRPRKGLEILLQALSDLKKNNYEIQLRAVGAFETKEYEEGIKVMTQQLGVEENIEWLGFTDNVVHEFHKMDAFVLPSLYGEGLPMVVLEAMAVGIPVVATEVEGVPEVISDKEHGLLVKPGSADELSQALELLVSGEVNAELLRMNAHQRQKECFSDVSMAKGVAQVYRKVLSS